MIPTSTNVTLQLEKRLSQETALAVFVLQKTSIAAAPPGIFSDEESSAVSRLLQGGIARGKAKEVTTNLLEVGGKRRPLLVVGLGPAEKLTAESFRDAAGSLCRAARRHRIAHLSVALPQIPSASVEQGATLEAIVSGFLLASFRYEEYKGLVTRKKESDEPPLPMKVSIVVPAAAIKVLQPSLERARAIADGQNFARTIAFRPGNDINPPALAKVAQQLAKEASLDVRILDERQMQKLGMGGILAVGQGSKHPPRLIILQYRPGGTSGARARAGRGQRDQPLLIVGKAITFDTGGISIKPADRMQRMIFDKCGAMAVLGLMYAVGKLKPSIPVIGILSSAENHISGDAYRPGDILRMYNGVTVEVTNTDAEGRLVLADALAWGIETYKPAAALDLATLTGGVVVALGKSTAGVMSNNDVLFAEIQQAANRADEKIWRLPLWDEHREYIKSDFADIVNSGGREGHPLQGGAFLSHFIPSKDNLAAGLAPEALPWAHLDIAGVADTEKETPCFSKGATGWGVRTLFEWVASRAGL